MASIAASKSCAYPLMTSVCPTVATKVLIIARHSPLLLPHSVGSSGLVLPARGVASFRGLFLWTQHRV